MPGTSAPAGRSPIGAWYVRATELTGQHTKVLWRPSLAQPRPRNEARSWSPSATSCRDGSIAVAATGEPPPAGALDAVTAPSAGAELEERGEPVLAPAIAVHGKAVFTAEAQRDTALWTR